MADRAHSPSAAELLTVFGGRIEGSETASDGRLIVRGANGVFATRSTWYDRDDREMTVWVFDLPPHERVSVSLAELRSALKRLGATYSIYTHKWHFEQPHIVAAIDALVGANMPDDEPCSVDEAARILGLAVKPIAKFPVVERAIIKPVQPPEAIASPPAVTTHGGLVRIPHAYVGELTGSISGNVYCYGYAVHDGVCVYLNMGGPRMAVEAIRAKLSKGEIVTLVPWDAPSVELTAGEGNTGMYHDCFANVPEARFTSLVLLHEMVMHPNYGGAAVTCILYASDAQAVGQLHRHVFRLVKVPVFAAWGRHLWDEGQRAGLVRKARGAGGLTVYAVELDADAWTRLITAGLERGAIALPTH